MAETGLIVERRCTGKVPGGRLARHTSEEFVRFLEEAVLGRRRQKAHVILDDLSAHKTPPVKAWLVKHPNACNSTALPPTPHG